MLIARRKILTMLHSQRLTVEELSGDRGEIQGRRLDLTEIGVFDELPESLFTSPQPVDWEAMLAP